MLKSRESAQRLEDLVAQIADSDTFRSAPMMRKLLVYLWKHQGETVGEYAIAVDALGRPADFDPKADSTVRVQIARLRAKLKEFYQDVGDTFPLRLTIPLGRHELEWAHEPVKVSWLAEHTTLSLKYIAAAGAIGLVLAGLCVFLLIQNRTLKASNGATASLPRFWRSFLVAGKPNVIVVPSPLYFFWPDHNVYVRDLKISEFANWPASPLLKDMTQKWGPPVHAQIYVGAMEMGCGVKILQYLDRAGQDAKIMQSRQFATDSLGSQNTIFLGMPRTTNYLDPLLSRTSFYIDTVEPDVIRLRNPQPGERAEFRQVDYSADRRTHPSIVILPPTRPEGTRTLLLMGRILTGMSALLSSLDGLKMVDQAWAAGGSPDAWEMVVETEVFNDTVLKVRPVAFRSIPASFWK